MSTSATCSSIERLRWRIPIPPSRASAIASRASVTVSIAAETTGMLHLDRARQPGARRDVVREHARLGRHEQDVVEGEPLAARTSGRGRAAVARPRGECRYSRVGLRVPPSPAMHKTQAPPVAWVGELPVSQRTFKERSMVPAPADAASPDANTPLTRSGYGGRDAMVLIAAAGALASSSGLAAAGPHRDALQGPSGPITAFAQDGSLFSLVRARRRRAATRCTSCRSRGRETLPKTSARAIERDVPLGRQGARRPARDLGGNGAALWSLHERAPSSTTTSSVRA